jgi:hypothetical protein
MRNAVTNHKLSFDRDGPRGIGSVKELLFRSLALPIPLVRNPMRRRRVHALQSVMPLLRRHLPPLLAQLLAPFRRHLAESIEGVAHFALPFGRQRLEFLPALTQHLPLLRRHGAPLTESLLGAGALLRRHGYPALAAFRKRLLALCRQVIPLALVTLQHLPLLRRKRLPGPRCCSRRRRRSRGSGRRRGGRGRRGLREACGDA